MAPTLKQIAQKTSLSIRSVSRILNTNGAHLFHPQTREKVLRVARELGYRPSAAAQAMRRGGMHQIGAFIRNAPDNPMTYLDTYETLLGINQRLERAGYLLALIRLGDVVDDSAASRVFRENVLDGVMVLHHFTKSIVRRVDQVSPHTLWVDTNVWRPQCCIRRNETEVGRELADRLAALGYRRVWWFGPPPKPSNHFSVTQRLKGLQEGVKRNGLKFEVCYLPQDPPDNAVVQKFSLRPRPGECVVAYDTPLAKHLLTAANSVGRIPGHHFGLACCDGTYDTSINWPGLTRIGFDRFRMGVQAAEMMLELLKKTSQPCPSRLLAGQWIAGDTASGPAGAGKGRGNTED